MDDFTFSDQEAKAINSSDFSFVPGLTSGNSLSERDQNYLAVRLGYIKNNLNPRVSVQEGYMNSKQELATSESPEDVVRRHVAEFREKFAADVMSVAANMASPTTADVVTTAARETIHEATEKLSGPDSLQATVLLAMSKEDNPLVDEQIAQQYFAYKLNQMTEDTGFWDDTLNVLGNWFLPGYQEWAVDNFFGDESNIATAGWHLKDFVYKFNSLPPEEKVRMWPQLVKEFKAAGGTDRAVDMLRNVVDPHKAADAAVTTVLDAVALAPMLGVVKNARKGASFIRSLRNMKNAEEAGKVAAATILDETGEVAKAVGTPKDDVAAGAIPFSSSQFDDDAVKGISHETITAIRDAEMAAHKGFTKAFSEENTQHVRMLDPIEETKAQQQYLKNLEEDVFAAYAEKTGWVPYNARITKTDRHGFTFEYDMLPPDGSPLVNIKPKPRRVEYTRSDITGKINVLEAGPATRNIGSMVTWGNLMANEKTVQAFGQIENIEYKLLQDMRKSLSPLFKKVKPKQLKKVDAVALAGDSFIDEMGQHASKVFSPRELMHEGVPTDMGLVRLSDDETVAYYALRRVYDEMFRNKNALARRQKIVEGKQGIKIPTVVYMEDGAYRVVDADGIGRVVDRIEIPERQYVSEVYDSTASMADGIPKTVSLDEVPEFLRKHPDTRLVKLDDTHFIDRNTDFTYVLVKDDKVVDLPDSILHYQPGYVPRINKDYQYIVKEIVPVLRNGLKGTREDTVRLFEREKDAHAYVRSLNKDLQKNFTVTSRKNMSPQELEALSFENFGGLYTKPRSKRVILYNLDGDMPARYSAFEAMERLLGHLAVQYPLQEYKMRMIQKFLNGAEGFLTDPSDWTSPIKNIPGNAKLQKTLEDFQGWLKGVAHMQDKDDRFWSSLMEGVAEFVEGRPKLGDVNNKGLLNTRRIALSLAERSPVAFARTSAFKAFLGWFNVFETFVQAQMAAVALAMDPLRAPRYLDEYMALRMAMTKPDNAAWVKMAGKLSPFHDEADFKKMVDEFRRSGWADSLRNSAEFNKPEYRFSLTPGWFRRLSDAGLFFYREGELFSRMYSWLVARNKWIEANGRRAIDDVALREINNDTLDLTFNMTRAARAKWQKGLLSIPTQFMSINARYIESSLPHVFPMASKTFSLNQIGRMQIAQLALYGTAGVPLGPWLVSQIAAMTGQDPTQLDEDYKSAINGGAWGYLASVAFGDPMDISGRLSLSGGINDMLMTVAGEGPDATLSKAAWGAFGSIPHRAYQAFGQMLPVFGGWSEGVPPNPKDLLKLFSAGASVASSFNNSLKAYLWLSSQKIYDSHGNVVLNLETMQAARIALAKSLGIQPAMLRDFYELKKYNYNNRQNVYEVVSALLKMTRDTMANRDWDDPDVRDAYFTKKAWLLSALSPLQRNEARKQFASRYANNEDRVQEVVKEAIDNYMQTGSWSTSPLGGNVGTNSYLNRNGEE